MLNLLNPNSNPNYLTKRELTQVFLMQIKHSHTSFIPSQQTVTHSIKHEYRHKFHINWNIKHEPV